jgi:hypothetical protein
VQGIAFGTISKEVSCMVVFCELSSRKIRAGNGSEPEYLSIKVLADVDILLPVGNVGFGIAYVLNVK